MIRRRMASGAVALCVALLWMTAGTPAWASCAVGVPDSPYAFAGTVLSTERQGRVALVRTDDGRSVEVVGTPAGPDPVGPDPGGAVAATSVDRTYEVGVRYEFHPLDATTPFDDNICTATRALPPLPTTAPAPPPVAAPQDRAPFPATTAVAAAAVLLGLGAITVLLVRRRAARARRS